MREFAAQVQKRSLLGAYTANLGQFVSRKKVEALARAAAAEARLARQASLQALSKAGRDMKAPIDTIAAYCDLIRTQAKAGALEQGYLEHIARAAAQLRELSRQLEGYGE